MHTGTLLSTPMLPLPVNRPTWRYREKVTHRLNPQKLVLLPNLLSPPSVPLHCVNPLLYLHYGPLLNPLPVV